MTLPDYTWSWGASLALHIIAAAVFSMFVARLASYETPAHPVFAAINMQLSETAVTSDVTAGEAAVSVPPQPRPEVVPLPEEVREPPPLREILTTPISTPVVLKQKELQPAELQEQRDKVAKTMAAPESALADVAEVESIEMAGVIGAGTDTMGGFGSGVKQARASAVIRPIYPVGARRRGEEGQVLVELTVLASGKVADPQVKQGSGFAELDRAAESALKRARFAPASKGGKPVDSRIRLTFLFRLRD